MDLTACLRGDRDAWDAFLARYAPVIFSAVQRTVQRRKADCDAGEIRDIIQEVLVRLIKSDYRLLRSYDPSRSSLATWLTMVARSTAINEMRRPRLKTLPLEDPETAFAAPPSTEDVQPVQFPDALLSPRQRLVLRLLFDKGMSPAEIATVLGVDPQTIRSSKHRAISKLRRFLQKGGDFRSSGG